MFPGKGKYHNNLVMNLVATVDETSESAVIDPDDLWTTIDPWSGSSSTAQTVMYHSVDPVQIAQSM